MPRSILVAILIGLVGAVFALQGMGVLGGSAMSGSSFWELVGSVMVVIAVVLGVRGWRAMPR
jgi:hypothetical protein